MQDVVVRAARFEDKLRWLPLWAGYNAFYHREGPTAVSQAMTDLTWDRFFDAYEPMHCLVAEAGDDLIGFTHYLFHRNTVMAGPVCYLQDLFTSEAARGRGVGRALIEAVYDAARTSGSPRVYWQTQETNVTAQRLYDTVAEKSGFIVYRRNL